MVNIKTIHWTIILSIFLLAACTVTSPPPEEALRSDPVFAEEYRIGASDNLLVSVWQHADLSVSVPVRPDGKITVPVAGDVAVGGMTPEEVAAKIETVLSEYIREPVVTVTVTGMGSSEYLSRVRVTGAVGNPASIPYRPGMTVMDVVLDAGGVTEFANAGGTKLYRAAGDPVQIRLDRILNNGDMSTNLQLRPGDVIVVPQRIF